MSYEHINEDEISIINNEYDYSTVISTIDAVAYLVQYCDNIYKNFIALTDEDEKRNEQFKQEFKNYTFKKVYSDRFAVYIRNKHYNFITYKDFVSFQSAINTGNLTNVDSLEIQLKMNFERGNGNKLVEYENSFSVVFKPYDIKFTRMSNHNELKMNQIENGIRDILNKFQTVNTIFCTK